MRRFSLPAAAFLASFLCMSAISGAAQTPAPVCRPSVTPPVIVDTHDQIKAAGPRAEPPLINTGGFGFAWPDTQMGAIKTANGYEFFTSDGAYHPRQLREGHSVGNNKYGSITTTTGTLDNPLGTGNPQDVSISANPDPAVNPNYSSYSYLGGGSVFQVPPNLPHAGSLLVTYHAELPSYALLGLAASTDNGLRWTDLGEIVRLNQAYEPGLEFVDIGDGHMALSPDAQYFYLYFPDWMANGTLNPINSQGMSTQTNVSVARAPAASLLAAAFAASPRAVPFEKYYQGSWHLQPALGGASTDLNPHSKFPGYLDVHFNSYLQRYIMITSDDTIFSYSESADGLVWTLPIPLGNFGPIAAYPTSIGLGDDPAILGNPFYVYFTYLKPENGGLPREHNSLQRFTVTCPSQ